MSIYGIDLGTTNSLIGLGDKLLSGLVPSVVDMEKEIAGASVKNSLSAERSFKVDISMSDEGTLSIVASKHVLKELKRQAGGSEVRQVVISVPAYFSDNQRQATIRAAHLADLEVVGLINEPTAAAMYISKDHRSLFVVYDLGGGTFDVSVIDSRFGNYDVQATDGLIVGGDKFDQQIMRHFIKEGKIAKHRLGKEGFMKLQLLARKSKEDMQSIRKDMVINLEEFGSTSITFTEDAYIQLMKLTFAETIIKLRKVIGEAIPYGEKYDIILVGGSTRCPYLREWIEQSIGIKPVELFYDPDKVVAQGAAMYAQMLENKEAAVMVSDVTNALSIGMTDGTVRTIIEKNSKIPVSEKTMVTNNVASSKMTIDLYQGDSLMTSANECIGTLEYDYGEIKEALEGNVIVEVSVEASGVISFSCKEMMKPAVIVKLDRSLSKVK